MSTIVRLRMRMTPLAILIGWLSIGMPSQATTYTTPSGAKPDLQSKQVVNAQTTAITSFTNICRDPTAANGRYTEIAELLAGQLDSSFGASVGIVDLNSLNDDESQIVIGDITMPIVSQLAADWHRSTLDLGEEGYDLLAAPNPASTNGSWIILILGNDSKGVFHGCFALVDLLQPGGSVQNLRIRDYPDYENRTMMHWLPPLPKSIYDPLTVAQWMANQRTSFEQIAGWGVNALTIGRSEFWNLDQPAKDGSNIGARMAEVAYWARYYGMELVPEVGSPLPYADPLWREGAFIRDEPFLVQSDLTMTPEITPLDNHALGLDFDTPDGGAPPFANGWYQGGGAAQWQYDANGGFVHYSGIGAKSLRTMTWDLTTLKPGSFYVLEAHFNGVASGQDASGNTQYMWLGVGGAITGGPTQWFFHDFLRNRAGRFVEDFYFWTPPSAAQVATDPRYQGYQGVQFEQLSDMRIQFYNADLQWTTGTPIVLQIDEIFLERRNGSLRNVMWDRNDPSYLKFTVTSNETDPLQRTTYVEGVDYDLNHVLCPSYAMPTRTYDANGIPTEYLSSLEWKHPNDVGKTVLVSYTLGVPDDWNDGQAARTWCLKSPRLRDAVKNNLRRLYQPASIDPHGMGAFQYAFAPAAIEINVSEFRGANRCGRCVDAGDSNEMYFANYLQDIMAILDELAQEGFTAAQHTDVMAGGSFSPGSILKNGYWIDSPGEQDDYQFRYGGRYGDTALRQAGLAVFASSPRRIIFPIGNGNCPNPWDCNGWEYAARGLGWPYDDGAPGNVFILAMNNSDTGANPEHTASGEGIYDASTWLLPDCLGFYSIGPGYGSEPIVGHEEKEQKLMDYAWRRYSNPDATLQVFRPDGTYKTDDVADHLVNVEKNKPLRFYPFGSTERRDPGCQSAAITSATIVWGNGSQTTVPFSTLNSGYLSKSYSQVGSYTVRLSITASACSGGSSTTDASVRVNVLPTCPREGCPDPTESPSTKPEAPITAGIRVISPNPFLHYATVHFSVKEEAVPEIRIYDIAGRLLRSEVLSDRSAGDWQWTWDGKNNEGTEVRSGIYFIRMSAGSTTATARVVKITS